MEEYSGGRENQGPQNDKATNEKNSRKTIRSEKFKKNSQKHLYSI